MNKITRSKFNVDTSKKGKKARTEIDFKTGKTIQFDSLLEKKFYDTYIITKMKSGELIDYELQCKYQLQPSFKRNGETIRAIDYVADFWIKFKDNTEKVIDTKGGMVDSIAKIKRKIMWKLYPEIDYEWLTHTNATGWINWDEYEKIKRDKKKEKKKKEVN